MFLIDKLKELESLDSQDREALMNAVAVDGNDVAHYLYASEKETWNPALDFPCIRPPFPLTWIEYYLHIDMLTEEDRRKYSKFKYGHLLIQSKNTVIVKSWGMEDDEVMKMMVKFRYKFKPDGTLETSMNLDGQTTGIEVAGETKEASEILNQGNNAQEMMVKLCVPFLTLSFMSCKNIESVLTRESPHKLNVKRSSQGKPPLTKIYTLKIDGVKRLFQSQCGSNSLSKNSLHLCRGHFKDFSHGQGLFGKYTGRYWWGSVLRGKKEYGEIIKDYQVTPAAK
jgi:hypothetical protein